jgi:hypothetical protein
VQNLLEEFYYEPEPVEDIAAYCVVAEQDFQHADIPETISRELDTRWPLLLSDARPPHGQYGPRAGSTPLSEVKFVLRL